MTVKEAFIILLDGSHKHGAKLWLEAKSMVDNNQEAVNKIKEATKDAKWGS